MHYSFWTPHSTVDETRRIITQLFNVGIDRTCVITLKQTGEVIGQVGAPWGCRWAPAALTGTCCGPGRWPPAGRTGDGWPAQLGGLWFSVAQKSPTEVIPDAKMAANAGCARHVAHRAGTWSQG